MFGLKAIKADRVGFVIRAFFIFTLKKTCSKKIK